MERRTTPPAAEEAQQQDAPQLWIPAPSSMCLLVRSAALAPAGSSIVQQHAGCTVRLPPPLPPNHAATWCPHRPVFHKVSKTSDRTAVPWALRLLRFPSNCSHTWFQRTFVVTFCVRASHADVYPEWFAGRLGQETTSKMAHPTLGAASLSLLTKEHRGHGAPSRVASYMLNEPAQGVLDRTVRSCSWLPRTCSRTSGLRRQRMLANAPSLPFRIPQSTRGARARVWRCTDSWRRKPSSIAHSAPVLSVTCAWPSSTYQYQVRPH